jgi:2-polyprenyl-3-methyl-5-hydroxy-6-metoxy-1,4-benzoquinol methylase
MPTTPAFSGERPGRGPGYDYDDSRHQVVYRHVLDLVAGRTVVDAGAGDGAGSAVLATVAAHVTGLDHHAPSVAAATREHGRAGLEFRHADLADPWPVRGADVVVAFQIIEHFEDDHAFVAHALDAVAPGGLVVITTPNVRMTFSENPWHVREYRAEELTALLAAHSDDVDVLGVFGNDRVAAFDRRRRAEVDKWLRLDPLRLRDRLPRPVVEWAFATLSTVVRRRASGAGGRPVDGDGGRDDGPITIDDFEVRPGDLEECLDFFALVRRTG